MADVGEAVDNVADSLRHKLGPLPAWAWAAIASAGVAGVILVRRHLNRGGNGDPAEPGAAGADDTVTDELTGTPSPFLPGGFVVGGGPTPATGNTGDPEPPAAAPAGPTTNSDWAVIAARYLIGRGYQGTMVTDALGRYLSGMVLTPQAQAIVDAAISGVGAPPQTVPPPTVSPKPEPTPSPGGGGTTPKPKPAAKAPAKPPAKAVAKPPAKPKPAPAPERTHTVRSNSASEYPYNLYRTYYGKAPSVAELQRWAAHNGLTLGGPPAYNVPGHRVGKVYKFPTKAP